jgi:hypothetical protein
VSEADDLRKEISKRREAVTRKIARLRREKSVTKLSGSDLDPRIPHSELKGYSEHALKIVLHEYNQFVNRNNQYIGGRKGVPLPAHEFREEIVKRAARLSTKAKEWESKYGDIRTPDGERIAEAKTKLAKRDNQDQSFSPYSDYKIDPSRFSSVDQMRAFEDRMSPKDTDNWEEENTRGNRAHLYKILDAMGESREEYEEMTDFQLMILWNGTNFMEAMGIKYETYKAANDDDTEKMPYSARTVEDSNRGLQRLPQWAKSLPQSEEQYLTQRDKDRAKEAKRRK